MPIDHLFLFEIDLVSELFLGDELQHRIAVFIVHMIILFASFVLKEVSALLIDRRLPFVVRLNASITV